MGKSVYQGIHAKKRGPNGTSTETLITSQATVAELGQVFKLWLLVKRWPSLAMVIKRAGPYLQKIRV